jgi:imidazolonepropionase-like amidohydrolase
MFDGNRRHGATTVLVRDGRILGVEPGHRDLPGDVPVLDLGMDTTLLPGLVDAHLHLVLDASADPTAALTGDVDEAALLDRMRATAVDIVRAGITTVRDLGDRDYLTLRLREEFARRPETGPHLLVAGPPLTTPGGHWHFLGGATPAAKLPAAVWERFDRGCDVVKIMASGGHLTTGTRMDQSQFWAPDLTAVVETAHRLGLPVAAHAHGVQSIGDAVAAGVDFIEHCSFLRGGRVVAEPDLFDAVAASGAVAGGTFGFASLPVRQPGLLATLNDVHGAFAELVKRDARIVVGTDGGVGPLKPHHVLPYAVAHDLGRIGLGPAEALATVTSGAADALGLTRRKGRIAVGADADLLAVAGDPVDDPARLRDVRAVFRAGVRIR